MNIADIVYENGPFWVRRAKKGYEVYKSGLTHSVRVASIGYEGQIGFERAKAEADRRSHIDAVIASNGGE